MRPTRRALLLGGAVATVGACTRGERDGRPTPVDPDVALRAEAVARERALVASYDALLAAEPARAAVLGPLRAEHAAHLAALGAEPAASTAPPTAPPTAPAAPPTAPPVPTVAALVQAERAAAAAHAAATVPASAALAAVLAQLAASEASHPVALA